jgi:DNA-3-methyladenine glycosylase
MACQPPDPLFRFDPCALDMREPPRSFYLRPTAAIARALIGKWIARQYQGCWYGGRIVETEAYLGSKDAAAHSWRGRRTPRVEPMYMEGGHLYVFLVYGMHACANIVTRPAGIGEAVLIRAAEGPPGAPPGRMSGPGRLCSALGINVSMSGTDLLAGGDVRLFSQGNTKRRRIGITPRIGVDYAGEARLWLLRFFDLNSPAVSGPARLRTSPAKARSESPARGSLETPPDIDK